MKYILITGGVVSGIGKGVVTSSIGALLKACNLRVTAIKIDPYINIDAGMFSPYEHGEVFVLNDGCEVDLDLGNYERFLDIELSQYNNITTGKINQLVNNRERKGDYLGKTVQIIPHVTDAIQQWIERAATGGDLEPEICLIELGGTIGDIENMPFIEALRQLRERVDTDNFCCCHVSLVPCIGPSKEQKSKPTQRSVTELRTLGLPCDVIVCRCEQDVSESIKEKISYNCSGVKIDNVFSLKDLKSIYQVPSELQRQGIIKTISKRLKINACACDRMSKWIEISDIALNATHVVIVALVGKYTELEECYASVKKSLEHACYHIMAKPEVRFIDSAALEGTQDNDAWKRLKSSHCLIVPGGFGIRGVEGKIDAIHWARENKIPFLGICLGFQMAVVEWARNVIGIKDAHSAEFAPEMNGKKFTPIVIEMLEYVDPEGKLGGTMRLGLRTTRFVVENSILKQAYGNKEEIQERHRHRYEINTEHLDKPETVPLKLVQVEVSHRDCK